MPGVRSPAAEDVRTSQRSSGEDGADGNDEGEDPSVVAGEDGGGQADAATLDGAPGGKIAESRRAELGKSPRRNSSK